jgi:hypothetical protein
MRQPLLRLVAIAACSLVITGCDLLYYYFDPLGVPPGDLGPPIASQVLTGTATIVITQGAQTQTVVLEGIGADSYLDPEFGGTVTWQNEDGWSVVVGAFDATMYTGIEVPGWMGDVTINRVQGNDFWTAGTYSDWSAGGCFVNVWELTASSLTGHANCTTLNWADGRNMSYDSSAYVKGQEPFDVTIDFEVLGHPEPPGQTS